MLIGILGSQTRDIVSINTIKNLIIYCNGNITPNIIANIDSTILLNIIKHCNYCNMKTKYLINVSKELIEKPEKIETLQGLLSLNGVGPKIAHLVLSVAYNQEQPLKNDIIINKSNNGGGIVVDTHVNRISNRIGLVKASKSAEHTRLKLESMFPKDDWNDLTVLLIGLGQSLCGSSPRCDKCLLHKVDLCSSSKQFILDRANKNNKHKNNKHKSITNTNTNTTVNTTITNNNNNDHNNYNFDNIIVIDDSPNSKNINDNNNEIDNNNDNDDEQYQDYLKDFLDNNDDNDEQYWNKDNNNNDDDEQYWNKFPDL